MTCTKKVGGSYYYSDEHMKDGNEVTPKDRNTKTEVGR